MRKTGKVLLFIGCLLLTACLNHPDEPTPFLAPTSLVVAAPVVTPTFESQFPTIIPTFTPTLPCENNLKFLEDLTIPDGMTVQPGELLDKRWRVQNSGTCNWDEGYHLELSSGSEMGVAKAQALYPARSGTEAVIRMLFTAPSESGNVRSAWQATDRDGKPFGDLFYIDITVAP